MVCEYFVFEYHIHIYSALFGTIVTAVPRLHSFAGGGRIGDDGPRAVQGRRGRRGEETRLPWVCYYRPFPAARLLFVAAAAFRGGNPGGRMPLRWGST